MTYHGMNQVHFSRALAAAIRPATKERKRHYGTAIAKRLFQLSTLRGLAMLAGAAGLGVHMPENALQIVSGGALLGISLWEVLRDARNR